MGCSFALIAAGSTAVSYHLNRQRDGEVAQPRESFEFFKSIKAVWDRIPAKVQSAMVQPSLWYCLAVEGLYYERVAPILFNGRLVDQVSTGVAAGLMTYGAVGPIIDLLRGRKTPDPKSFIIGGVFGFAAMGAVVAPHLGAFAAGSFALWAAGNYLNARRMQALQNGTAKAAHNAETGGTTWNEAAAKSYGHGPDGQACHDSRVVELLQKYLPKAQTILDVGCGTGCFASDIVEIAKNTANGEKRFIYFWDPNQAMLSECQKKIPADIPKEIEVTVEPFGVKNLDRFLDGSVNVVLSSLVGCNLNNETLAEKFVRTERLLKPGGVAIVTAPNSLDVVFTNGSETKEAAIKRMNACLAEIGEVAEADALAALRGKFNGDPSVLRATFIYEYKRIRLVDEGKKIAAGAPVYRLIPGLVVPNYAHTAEEYREAAEAAGLIVETADTRLGATLSTEGRRLWNENFADRPLGEEYEKKPPFAVFVFKKRAT
jgi:SAM-dependent methyltransferase